MKQYVILGNGVAAAHCIEGIRSVDKATPITVVSAENHPVYCRPLISYYLEDKADPARMNYRPEGFYRENGCTVLYGRTAKAIDPAQKTVILDDGESLPYTALCVATGSSPFVPPAEGLDSVEQKFTFLTLDDAAALKRAAKKQCHALIVGAGLIGLKCAEGLRPLVWDITVCDLADRVLSSILDNDCASRIQAQLEQHGVRFLLGDTVQRYEKNTAFMKSGKTVAFDLLVLAVGVRANTALVKACGGKTERGILVDERMQTSLPDIYAAGDCTQGTDVSTGQQRVLAILPNAALQGRCAGINMAGGNAVFDNAIPMNAIGFFGLHALSAGSDCGGETYEENDEKHLKRLYCKDNRLTGFMLIGDTARAGIYTSLIREKTPLDSLDFERLKQTPTTTAFSKQERRHKFGGAV
ncbi:MAG: NAD(P)/FAD-dependent oxidoreductase [Clostridia bacterium]|nr:NAD(P)/FAD-dependent oxidoreductase [Clostridia bacterium]